MEEIAVKRAGVRTGPGVLGVTYGPTHGSEERMRNMHGQIARWDDHRLHQLLKLNAELTVAMEEEIRTQFRPHDKTGETMNSMRVRTAGMLTTITMGGGAEFVEFGTGPHTITPKADGGVLRWVEGGTLIFFARYTNHPGARADDFLGRALGEVKIAVELQRYVIQAMTDIHVEPANELP